MMSLPLPQERLAAREATSDLPLFTVGWHHAIFEHYRITNEAEFLKRLPAGFELDHHHGHGYMSIVSFHMVAMKLGGIFPIPLLADYPQINIRAYVHREGKPGVFFLRNYVSNLLATWGGKFGFAMPYRYQPIQAQINSTHIKYSAALSSSQNHFISGRPTTSLTGHENDPESLLFFLAERYPLYSLRGIRLCESRMIHPPWALKSLEVDHRTHAIIDGLNLESIVEPLDEVQYSPGVDVRMWAPSVLY